MSRLFSTMSMSLSLRWAAALAGALLPLTGSAQTATDLNEGSKLIALGNNNYEFTWWARAGISYLVEVSDDLKTWNYLDGVFLGQGGVSAPVYFNNFSGDRLFVRLNMDPFGTDSDLDGLSDAWEVQHGTNPRLKDTDGDGILDGAELTDGTDPKKKDARAVLLQVFGFSTP